MRGMRSMLMVAVMMVGFSQMGASGCPPPTIRVTGAIQNVVPGYNAWLEIRKGAVPLASIELHETEQSGGFGQFRYEGKEWPSLECGGPDQYGFAYYMDGSQDRDPLYRGKGAGVADGGLEYMTWPCPDGTGSIDNNGVRWVTIDSSCHIDPVCKVQWAMNGAPDPEADPERTKSVLGLWVPDPGLPWQPTITSDLLHIVDDFDCGSYPDQCFVGAEVTGSGLFVGCLKADDGMSVMPMAAAEVWVTSFSTPTSVLHITGEDGCFEVTLNGYLEVQMP